LPVDLVTANGNTAAVQLRGVMPGQTYYLKVSSQTQSTGAYELAAYLGPETVTFARGGEGTLTPAAPAVHHDFALSRSGLVHMVLAADGAGTAVWTITDSDGNVVSQQLVQAGQGRSVDLLLTNGTYRISLGLLDPTQTVQFTLTLAAISDPVGARSSDPTGTPEPPDPNAPTSPPPPPDDIQWEPSDDPDTVSWY
jgi:hypothetical protein